ncbi:hypothetical protein N7527_008847 [Penicillium freii]|nr:hypothetical protein N7527_008847 [Penicillium freii]
MLCELLGLVQYTNIFCQNTGPTYEHELLRAVAQSTRSLVRDFINDVTAHWDAWHVSPTDITNDITLRLHRGERVYDFWDHHQLSSISPCFFLYLPHGFALFGWSLNMAYPSSKERRGERTTSYGRGYFLVSLPFEGRFNGG